jgi:hypothetical protein
MFEQLLLGLALIGCLVLVYRQLRPQRAGTCHSASCECEEAKASGAITKPREEGI